MLISHRRNAYLDEDELERAAGMMRIRCGDMGTFTPDERSVCFGAACALKVLGSCDLKTMSDFAVVFDRMAGGEDEEICR